MRKNMILIKQNNNTWTLSINDKKYMIKTGSNINEDLIQNALQQTHLNKKNKFNKSDENKLIEFLQTTYKFKVQRI